MKTIKNRHKIFLLCIALCMGFIIAELSLGLTAFINREFSIPHHDFSQIKDDEYLIYCLGDSFTYGIGASVENSYPAQMEKILQQAFPKKKIKALNLGVPGFNSSQISNRLKEVLKKKKPELVVVTCGMNDHWNLKCLKPASKLFVLESLLANTRINKTIMIYLEKLKSRKQFRSDWPEKKAQQLLALESDPVRLLKLGNAYRDFALFEIAKCFYKKASELSVEKKVIDIELGRCYKLDNDFSGALAVFFRLLNDFPDDEAIQAELEDVFAIANAPLRQIRFYEKFLKEKPNLCFAREQLAAAYIKIGGEHFAVRQMDTAKAYYQNAKDILFSIEQDINSSGSAESPEAIKIKTRLDEIITFLGGEFQKPNKYYLADNLLNRDVTEKILYDNVAEMIDLCMSQNVPIVFSGYPHVRESCPVPVKKLCFQRDIPLVVHVDSFCRALQKMPFEYYYTSREDAHCTSKGYEIMAGNIASEIMPLISAD